MKTLIHIENCAPPFCVIHAAEKNAQIEALAERISALDASGSDIRLNGWDGDFCISLKDADIFRVFSQSKKVFVETEKEILLLKMRLYEFEALAEKCGWTNFIRISNTDIVNFSLVKNLDFGISGIIKVNLANGNVAIVSRRYMNKIKSKIFAWRKHV